MVAKGDTFVCLGDVGNPTYVSLIQPRKKILLLENHDAKGVFKKMFDEVYSGPLFIADKAKALEFIVNLSKIHKREKVCNDELREYMENYIDVVN